MRRTRQHNNNALADEAQPTLANLNQVQPSSAKSSQVQPSPATSPTKVGKGGARWGEARHRRVRRDKVEEGGRKVGRGAVEKSQSSQLSPAKSNQPFTQPSSANPPTKLSAYQGGEQSGEAGGAKRGTVEWGKAGRAWMDGSGGRKRESKLSPPSR